MKIVVPPISEQKRMVVIKENERAIHVLNENANAPAFEPVDEINEGDYDQSHLLNKGDYMAPHADIVGAYFRQFQNAYPEYGTDKDLAKLLDVSSDRRIREYKSGARKVPYELWDKFLIMTGRKPQKILKVFGFFS